MSKLGLSSQILQNTRRYTGKLCDVISWNSPCVFAMRCGKNRTLFDFLHFPRGFRVYGNDTWIKRRLDNMAPARVHPCGLNLTNGNGP